MSSAGRARAGRFGGIRAAGLVAFVGLMAAGCATLPSSGPITKVGEGDEGASQVQIWPSPPSICNSATEIVGGFLEAARSGAANQRIAADYLTTAMQGKWRREQNTVIVLADYSEGLPQPPSGSGQQAVDLPPPADDCRSSSVDIGATSAEQVVGTVIGRLDSQGLYSAESAQGIFQFTVEMTKAGYRISQLPADFGVLMERSDFESSYSRHVVYYENPLQVGAFVPTAVYLPSVDSDDEVARQMAQLIVAGVPTRLSPALQDAVTGAQFVGLSLDGGGATVTIKGDGACKKSQSPCDELAQQLAQSLGGLGLKVGTVAVDDESTGQTTEPYPPLTGPAGYGLDESGLTNQNRNFYAVSADGNLESVGTSGGVDESGISFSGSEKLRFKQVAVAPGSLETGNVLPGHLALLGSDGHSVYVARRQGGAETLSDVFPDATAQSGGTVGQLAWDSASGAGASLWFTYTVGHVTSLYRYFGGQLSQVSVAGLPGATIASVSPAPDGDRVAIGYVDAQGDYWISIGAVATQSGGGFGVDLGGGDSEVVAAAWSSITRFDWYNEDSLAVLGQPPSAQELGLYQLYADGSPVYDTLTLQPVQASPPSQADGFVWNAGGQPIAAAVNQGKETLYTLSVEGQEAHPLAEALGTSPSY